MNGAARKLNLNVGEIVVDDQPATVSTTLGSCVSVCLFTKDLSAAGIIHFALPRAEGRFAGGEPTLRYGDVAIAALIEDLKSISGQPHGNFVAKLVGGAAIEEGSSLQAGGENILFAKSVLARYGIPIVGESVGGELGRQVIFHIPSGRLQVAKLPRTTSVPRTLSTPHTPMVASGRRRRVLIVDDSKTIRGLLERILREDPDMEIVGSAQDAEEAQHMFRRCKPDVITLDIHMPGLTGVEWLEKWLPSHPIPVVMISSLQLQEGNEVFRALELGAVDYIQKPSFSELATAGPLIREKVKEASFAKVVRVRASATRPSSAGTAIDMNKILAIGASTGGTEAIKSVLCSLPEKIPPTVIVQHIPATFSGAFANRMNQLCPFEVKEAEDMDEVRASRVLIAPGGKQMKIQSGPRGYCVRITDDAPVNRHKPSVDYLFDSLADLVGGRAVGVILTGMGNDGAKGLLALRKKGAHTIGQDEASSVVYGMPRVAFEIGGVEKVAPLSDVPKHILQFLKK